MLCCQMTQASVTRVDIDPENAMLFQAVTVAVAVALESDHGLIAGMPCRAS